MKGSVISLRCSDNFLVFFRGFGHLRLLFGQLSTTFGHFKISFGQIQKNFGQLCQIFGQLRGNFGQFSKIFGHLARLAASSVPMPHFPKSTALCDVSL
ncbi:hypothetical protein FZC76_20775 [Sutcliffiella horikoshii]|uniref:Uncharacterized protein n=1 Tax=Sutcliffiella horikoshii TaxID=79883 RepID=A0A5D4SK60_9BACI|nr:hypothetical protein FZC76_20775 [Sutcliffiella horikoshii]